MKVTKREQKMAKGPLLVKLKNTGAAGYVGHKRKPTRY